MDTITRIIFENSTFITTSRGVAGGGVPATNGIRGASLKTGDVLVFYAGIEVTHVAVFVLRDRAGEPLLIEKPNAVDDLRVCELSAHDGDEWVDLEGTDLGPTTKIDVWRPN